MPSGSLAISREIDDREGEVNTLSIIGFLLQSRGENDRALESFQQALEILKQKNDMAGQQKIQKAIDELKNKM